MEEKEIHEETINNKERTVVNDSFEEKNQKRKTKFLVIGILIVIAIGIGLYVGYKKLSNDPMSIYKDAINDIYKSLNKNLKNAKDNSIDSFNLEEDSVVLSLDANLESSMPELKNFSGLNYHFVTGLDLANNKMNVDLGIKDKNEVIINLIISAIDDNLYAKSDELYNKVLDLGEEDIFSNLKSSFTINNNEATVDYDNYSYILKSFKTILIDSLDKDKFTLEDETITINDKEYKTKKATYNLDEENMTRTIKFIQNRILKDDKLVTALAESLGLAEGELKGNLKDEIDMTSYQDFEIILYADKLNNLIAGSLLMEDEEIVKFDCVNNETNIVLKSDNASINILIAEDNYITIDYNEDGDTIFKLTFEGSEKEFKMPYVFNIDGMNITGSLELTNIKSSGDKASADFKFSFKTKVVNKDIDFTIDGKYSLEKASVTTLEPAGSVKIENISEEEAAEIFTKLETILDRFGLKEMFMDAL